MRLLVWNCQGLGGSLAVSQLEEMCRLHSPDVVFLMETKNQAIFIRKVCRKLKFMDFCVVDPVGLSGGLALLWQHGISINNLCTTHCTIELNIYDPVTKACWWFIGVYVYPNVVSRRECWSFLSDRMKLWGNLFVIAGDFNAILSSSEKYGGSQRSDSTFLDFRNFVSGNSLCDLGFQGQFWTWRRVVEGRFTTYERLDRFLCSVDWRDLFPRAVCKHIYTFASDHCFILGDTNPLTSKRRRSFIFDQRWLSKDGIVEAVRSGWDVSHRGSNMYRFMMKIKSVKVSILKWKGSRSFNAANRIKDLKNELDKAICLKAESDVVNSIRDSLIGAYKDEEMFWAQKSRVSWLRDGDRNTRFFHATVSNRRRKNLISVLKKTNSNDWCESFEDISNEFVSFYSALFSSSGGTSELDNYFGGMEAKVTQEMNQKLMLPISDEEIKQAVFGMKTHSAPGPDGMTPLFYKKFYDIIKSDLAAMIRGFFHSGRMLREVNQTCISLIPKQAFPFEVSHFRPISLCNVSYRILSKIMANRLKKVLPFCISPTQSAFISGRYILDNYVLAHEIINLLVHSKKGREGFMAFKIDMAKAFDRVEWYFIRFIMTKLGFCEAWVDRVLECISTTSYSFVINGVKTGLVEPSRGIRQGDPLSPYLFIICAEGLSFLLQKAEQNGLIQGMKLARTSPSISHLFFADDSLLVCKAGPLQASNLHDLLNIYQTCSGQLINYQKSGVFFSKNVDDSLKSLILRHFDGVPIVTHTKYLGLPLFIGRSKREAFAYLKCKVSTKLSSWKNNLLSPGGKEVLLKSVVTMLVSYPMSVLKLPKVLCNELSALMAKFWWGNGEIGRRGIPWLAWKKLCIAKGLGGMGFRDLEALNFAYLSRQIWRFIQNPDLLVSKVLKAKYFPHCSLLDAKSATNSSYFWKGIISVLPHFKEGVFWCIGNGESARIWEDNWLPDLPSCKPLSPDRSSPDVFWVRDLLIDRCWNKEKISRLFWPVDVNRILAIPVSSCNHPDTLMWRATSNGKFSIKSAYFFFFNKLNSSLISNNNQDNNVSSASSVRASNKIWKFLWSLSLPSKIKHFFWKCLKNILPCNSNISSRLRSCGISPYCSFCGDACETVEHILFSCRRAVEVWKMSPFSWSMFNAPGMSLMHWWEDLVGGGSFSSFRCKIEQTLFMFWHIWKARNDWIFNRNVMDPSDIVAVAWKDWKEFTEAVQSDFNTSISSDKPLFSASSIGEGSIGTVDASQLILHTDAAWIDYSKPSGGGVAIFDRNYNLVEVWGRSFFNIGSALRAEAEVIRWALLRAKEMNWSSLHIRTDSLLLSQMIAGPKEPNVDIAVIVKDIQHLLHHFHGASVSYFSRKLNIVSHEVAKFAKSLVVPVFWVETFPSWVMCATRKEMYIRTMYQTM